MENDKFKNYIILINNSIIKLFDELEYDMVNQKNETLIKLVNAEDFDVDNFKDLEQITTINSCEKFIELLNYIQTDEEMKMFGFYHVENGSSEFYSIPNNYLEFIPNGLTVYGLIDNEPMIFNKDDYITDFLYEPLPFGIKLKREG